MSDILYRSILKPRQVIEPHKYFCEGYEYLYEQDGCVSQYDEMARLTYYIKKIINPPYYGCEKADFESIFKKTLALDCEDTDKDSSFLKSLSIRRPIIIGGCGRSGTTLLLSILSSHSEVFGIEEELYCFYPVFRLKKIINFIIDKKKLQNQTWCEKTPKNVVNFNKIYDQLSGDVSLIHIVRDGRDVVTSRHPYHPEKYWVSKERWKSDVEAGLQCKNCILVKYEDLIFNPEKVLRIICDYCKIEFQDQMLKFQSFTNVKQNVAWEDEKVTKIHSNRVKKWKNVEHEDIINEFSKDSECMFLLERLGYERSSFNHINKL